MYSLFLDSHMEDMTLSSERVTKFSESNTELENAGIVDNPTIFGIWKGEFCGDRFILNFSEDGIMSEKTDGVIRKFAYRLENSVLIVSPSISDLNCVLGEELCVSFIDSDSMIVSGDLWKMEMVRDEELS